VWRERYFHWTGWKGTGEKDTGVQSSLSLNQAHSLDFPDRTSLPTWPSPGSSYTTPSSTRRPSWKTDAIRYVAVSGLLCSQSVCVCECVCVCVCTCVHM
jgi:hypothetical protein